MFGFRPQAQFDFEQLLAMAWAREAVPRTTSDGGDTMSKNATFDREFLDALQIEDIAKLIVKRGGVLAWQQGLGKTIAAMLCGKAMRARNAMFITLLDCPTGLERSLWVEGMQRHARQGCVYRSYGSDGIERFLRGGKIMPTVICTPEELMEV
jgi:hypothetical protein